MLDKYKDSRIIVVDDEHFKENFTSSPNVFFINPDPTTGLTEADRNQIIYLLAQDTINSLLKGW